MDDPEDGKSVSGRGTKVRPLPVKAKVKVKVLSEKGGTSLVEWRNDNGPQRNYVPSELVTNGEAEESDLAMGAVYGLPWEKFIKIKATPERLAQLLRESGIWTFGDLQAKANQVKAVLLSAYAVDLGSMIEEAQKYGS